MTQLTLPLVQLWRRGRATYRPKGEPIRTADYDVAEITTDTAAKAFVLTHHYSRTYPAARFRYGLYRQSTLVGVAVFSHPVSDHVLTNVFPGPATASTELGRFVLTDDVPSNGETWFLARVFALLRREGIQGVISFSDPVSRSTAAGEVVTPGHVGTIYQAFNGTYLGRGRARTLLLLPDGTTLNDRSLQKIRTHERNWQSAARRIEAFGAAPLTSLEDPVAWLATWLPRVTRPLRHPGNHEYAWPLSRLATRALPKSLPYPKPQPLPPPTQPHCLLNHF